MHRKANVRLKSAFAAAATVAAALTACGGSGSSPAGFGNWTPGNGTVESSDSKVAVGFSTSSPDGAPFPSDRYTVADAQQLSGRRVSLPKPDCAVQVSDCQDIDELGTLDGFSITPRFTVPFTGDIDPASVTSESVYLLRVGGADGWRLGERSGINQVAWDAPSRTLSFKSDQLLRERARYVLVVTNRVKDSAGKPLGRGEWLDTSTGMPVGSAAETGSYRNELRQALALLPSDAAKPVAASLFTTQTATAQLAGMVNLVKARPTAGLDFMIGSRNGATVRAVFDVANLSGGVVKRQVGTAPTFSNSTLRLQALQTVPGAVAQVAYASFLSPTFIDTATARITPVGTAATPLPLGEQATTVQIFVPSGPKPAGGWPVVLFGHGFGDSIQGAPWAIASVLASYGLATVSINVVGHGGGSQGSLEMTGTDGSVVAVATPGRGIDQNGDGKIDATEGSTALAPYGVIGPRDSLRQTVIDLTELARRFSKGVDLDGDGQPDFDGTRISYAGQSFGGVYGAMLLGVDPGIVAGVPNVGGGSLIEATRNGEFRILRAFSLASRKPSLINLPPANGIPQWDDNQPFRNEPPLTRHVDGALAIAKSFDNSEWAQQAGVATAYAPLLRLRPLPGHQPKPVILQYAKGDNVMSNPSSAWIVRGGELNDRVSFYRHDLALAANAAVGSNPHGYLLDITNPAAAPYALQAQRQIGSFLASGGATFSDADGPQPFFEVGLDPAILDKLNFVK
jgi:hypothetical protein